MRLKVIYDLLDAFASLGLLCRFMQLVAQFEALAYFPASFILETIGVGWHSIYGSCYVQYPVTGRVSSSTLDIAVQIAELCLLSSQLTLLLEKLVDLAQFVNHLIGLVLDINAFDVDYYLLLCDRVVLIL